MKNKAIRDALDDLISIKHAAEIHHISSQAIDYRIEIGDLQVTTVAGRKFVSKSAVENLKIRDRNDGLVHVGKAAEMIGVQAARVRFYIRTGVLKATAIGGELFVSHEKTEQLAVLRQNRRLATVEQAAEIYGGTAKKIEKLIEKGKLQPVRVNGHRFVLKSEVTRLAAARTKK